MRSAGEALQPESIKLNGRGQKRGREDEEASPISPAKKTRTGETITATSTVRDYSPVPDSTSVRRSTTLGEVQKDPSTDPDNTESLVHHQSGEATALTVQSLVLKKPLRPKRIRLPDNLTIPERKRQFIESPSQSTRYRMRKWVKSTLAFFSSTLSAAECWHHPFPGKGGNIVRSFGWSDLSGSHSLLVNYGIVALLVISSLTKEQKEGYIEESWHLSHLCGNWTCCNWRHFTVESGRVNTNRNRCMRYANRYVPYEEYDRNHCQHKPVCMGWMKETNLATTKSTRVPEDFEWEIDYRTLEEEIELARELAAKVNSSSGGDE